MLIRSAFLPLATLVAILLLGTITTTMTAGAELPRQTDTALIRRLRLPDLARRLVFLRALETTTTARLGMFFCRLPPPP